jgi:molecular chaperone GrpE
MKKNDSDMENNKSEIPENEQNVDENSTQDEQVSTEEMKTETTTPENQEKGEETGETEELTPEQHIMNLEEEVASLKDKLLRKQADYENFRKRLFREKEESMKYANQMVLLDITSVIDDFERAIKSAEESKDFNAFHDGIVMIEKRLVSTLEKKWELKRFDSVGEVFDPEKHLAIAVEENSEHEVPTVLEDYQKGYLFHERILRPAKVKVSQPVTEKDTTTEKNNQESDKDQE